MVPEHPWDWKSSTYIRDHSAHSSHTWGIGSLCTLPGWGWGTQGRYRYLLVEIPNPPGFCSRRQKPLRSHVFPFATAPLRSLPGWVADLGLEGFSSEQTRLEEWI